MTQMEGVDKSLWVATTPETNFPKLAEDQEVYDLAIVGGGITGVAAAHFAQEKGLKAVLVERNRLVEWTTGGTTAKLSSQHYLIYDYLINRHGKATAKAFADANERGIDAVERISTELGIDAEFARRDAYVFTRQDDRLDEMRAEVEAAQRLGLPASFETEFDLPFEITGAVKFADQAQFHPRKFLLGLVDRFVANGGVIYEITNAEEIVPGEPNVVKTDSGDLSARFVLQASGEPFWRNEIFDGFMWLKMSYALAVRLKDGAEYPRSMYITPDDPMRTIRSATYEGQPVMIFGGESHEYDEATYDEDKHYAALIEDVHSRFDVDEVLFRWLAGDFMPYDRMPFIGALPDTPSVYVITGYRAWGLAWAMSASAAVVNDMVGEPEDWVAPFGLERLSRPVPESERVHGI